LGERRREKEKVHVSLKATEALNYLGKGDPWKNELRNEEKNQKVVFIQPRSFTWW